MTATPVITKMGFPRICATCWRWVIEIKKEYDATDRRPNETIDIELDKHFYYGCCGTLELTHDTMRFQMLQPFLVLARRHW